MWEKWKNKIRALFTDTDNLEERSETHSPTSDHPQHEVQARVTYQYPKQKSFRFPVIPDEPEERVNQRKVAGEEKKPYKNREEEGPAYTRNRTKKRSELRNRTQNIDKTRTNVNNRSENKSGNRSNEESTWQNNKIVKTSDEPFKVTEVPSPIFGFHKRDKQEKEINDIPAYLRKNRNNNKENKSVDEPSIIHKNNREVAATVEESIETGEKVVEKVKIDEQDSGRPANKIKEMDSLQEEQKMNSAFLGDSEIENFHPSKEPESDEEDQPLKDEKSIKAFQPVAESESPVKSQQEEEQLLNSDEHPMNVEAVQYKEESLQPDSRNSTNLESEEPNETEKYQIDEKVNEQENNQEKDMDEKRVIGEEVSHPTEKAEGNLPAEAGDEPLKHKANTSPKDKPYVFPFNVIMTPSDKRNMRRRQMEQNNNYSKTNHDTVQGDISKDTLKRENENEELHKSTIQGEHSQGTEEPTETFIPYHLLNDPIKKSDSNQLWVEEQQRLLEQTLKHFNVRANVVKATQGPSVTRFEVHPELGVKVSKIKNLSDDLKLNMAAEDIRIEAPIPGKNTVGIEIPNQKAQMVGLQEIFETEAFKGGESPLTIALGLSIEGEPKITNIQKMPHGLIAGATGSGKSVCINTILVSLLYKASYEDVKILLIDPKMVELAPYNGIPHLVAPVITDVKAATQSLKWAVNEMEERYEKFVHEGVRNIEGYNKKMIQYGRSDDKMPFIVIVIDELADLMMTSPQDVEDSISRIAQKARACGIHLILATQRPSVDVITGLIKANIPTRIAFSVSSQVDSRTIIDVSGAEKLLGKGDMLFVENGAGKSVRLQGPFVSDEEIERVTNYARSIAEPNYLFEQEELLEQVHVEEEEDELLQDVIDFVVGQNSASTSMIQRRFKIGYNRAARLIDTLEYRGIISGQNGSKPRDVLISQKQEEM
ncbi:DNA translocase FtsK [Oceanobacillus salinisoli]|uniref:DNA translocase FtsK n=1 Tax=Oceanobacillus salinisoli TaxID=2678611 RepID=UPI0012E12C21|nr:DNA translocase FtsK [Oceanobacillus salinisoli]